MKVYFAADHAGFELKKALIEAAQYLGREVEDCGAFEFESEDDYPDFMAAAAAALVRDITAGYESRAILIGASGQGEAMAANRFKGVRCAVYYGPAAGFQTDAQGRELDLLTSTRIHNNANALAFGARFITREEAVDAMERWLNVPFSREERHARRVDKLDRLG